MVFLFISGQWPEWHENAHGPAQVASLRLVCPSPPAGWLYCLLLTAEIRRMLCRPEKHAPDLLHSARTVHCKTRTDRSAHNIALRLVFGTKNFFIDVAAQTCLAYVQSVNSHEYAPCYSYDSGYVRLNGRTVWTTNLCNRCDEISVRINATRTRNLRRQI
jgi:hypothetical protein